MAKNQRANLTAIEQLHGTIATVLNEVLQAEEEETELVDMGDGLMEEEGTGKMRYSVSPAMMAQAINFVHKQGVVADLEGNKDMSRLKATLDKKQKQSRLGSGKVASIDQAREQAG
jgi:hypothetical protein